MMRRRNIERANRAAKALRTAYGKEARQDYSVADMLADLRHLCDKRGLAFHELDRTGYEHYVAEVQGRE